LAFVHLSGSADLFRQRLENRSGHYMPASLLESQLQALEPRPPPSRAPRRSNATLAAATLAEQAATWLLALPPPAAKGKR
jgi:gluconate kinase